MDYPAANSLARRADSLRRAGELAHAERLFAVVTVVRTEPSTSARTGNRAIVYPDGEMEGWVGGGCIQPTARREGLAALKSGEPRLVRITPDTAASQHNVHMARMTCASEGTADLYIEPFLPRPTLVAAGAPACRRACLASHPRRSPRGWARGRSDGSSSRAARRWPATSHLLRWWLC
jgi:xanthine dehydrogenase accessory factor